MLTVSPEKAFLILMKARASDAEAAPDTSGPDSSLGAGTDVASLGDAANADAGRELLRALKSLNEDELTDLLALTWLGRGDIETWEAAVTQAREAQNPNAVRYLAGTPLLGDYLENGLSELGYSRDAYDMGRS